MRLCMFFCLSIVVAVMEIWDSYKNLIKSKAKKLIATNVIKTKIENREKTRLKRATIRLEQIVINNIGIQEEAITYKRKLKHV